VVSDFFCEISNGVKVWKGDFVRAETGGPDKDVILEREGDVSMDLLGNSSTQSGSACVQKTSDFRGKIFFLCDIFFVCHTQIHV
jgi:hypothetical protein